VRVCLVSANSSRTLKHLSSKAAGDMVARGIAEWRSPTIVALVEARPENSPAKSSRAGVGLSLRYGKDLAGKIRSGDPVALLMVGEIQRRTPRKLNRKRGPR
jgi:hypothetical protein